MTFVIHFITINRKTLKMFLEYSRKVYSASKPYNYITSKFQHPIMLLNYFYFIISWIFRFYLIYYFLRHQHKTLKNYLLLCSHKQCLLSITIIFSIKYIFYTFTVHTMTRLSGNKVFLLAIRN